MLIAFFHAYWEDPFYVMKSQGRDMLWYEVLGERLGKSNFKKSED